MQKCFLYLLMVSTAFMITSSSEVQERIITVSALRYAFYSTACKGCRGILFTHSVWMDVRQAGCRKKFVRAVSQKPQGIGS